MLYGSGLPERNTISISRNDSGEDYYPLTLTPGWFTIEVEVDYARGAMSTKAWADGEDEPDSWQVERALDSGWRATQVGFRHYGQGTRVDDLVIVEEMSLNDNVHPPLVTISAPTDGAISNQGEDIVFSGSANDPEDGDVAVSLTWVSSIDGPIGTREWF